MAKDRKLVAIGRHQWPEPRDFLPLDPANARSRITSSEKKGFDIRGAPLPEANLRVSLDFNNTPVDLELLKDIVDRYDSATAMCA